MLFSELSVSKIVAQRRQQMSADNTIAILVTRRRDGKPGSEFRVAHVMAVDNNWNQPDYPYPSKDHRAVFNREMVRANFSNSEVFYTKEEALKSAQELEKKIEIVEYGIRWFDFSAISFPASDD